MIEKTFKDLTEFNVVWNKWVRKNPVIENTKIGYAITKFIKKSIQPVFDEYNLALGQIRVQHALTDKTTGALLIDPNPNGRGFQYDRDGLRAVLKAEFELDKEWNPKLFHVEPYICKKENLPVEGLTDEQEEVFGGLIINLEQ